MERLLKEANELADQGVRELILVAQETTLYGVDLYGKKMLPELLHKDVYKRQIQNHAALRNDRLFPVIIRNHLINVVPEILLDPLTGVLILHQRCLLYTSSDRSGRPGRRQ